MSLPKPVNMPPNKPFASFMTSHSKGIATASIIRASRIKKSVFKMLPIYQTCHLFDFVSSFIQNFLLPV